MAFEVFLGTPALDALVYGGQQVVFSTAETVGNNFGFFLVIEGMWGVLFVTTWIFHNFM